MKILLSAFACEAGRGSEPGLGWNWAYHLARAGHDVWVITRSVGREANEKAIAFEGLTNLRFVYYDYETLLRRFGKTHLGYYTNCQLWQWGAYKVARSLHKGVGFDVVHHVTFATARVGSFMGRLKVPFIFGPVAGGERIPWRLRRSLQPGSKFREFIRDINNWSIGVSPVTRRTFADAERIYVTNPQTAKLIPSKYGDKCHVQLAIGHNEAIAGRNASATSSHGRFRMLYVGILDARKGIHLALRAFARASARCPNAEFTIIGKGSAEGWLKAIARELRIESSVNWLQWMPREEVLKAYDSYDVFMFPSLRDSGGMVVLEALTHGLPVVCLDLGGPGVIVNENCGRVISTAGASEEGVVAGLTKELIDLAENPALRRRLSEGAVARAKEFSWEKLVSAVYGTAAVAECVEQ